MKLSELFQGLSYSYIACPLSLYQLQTIFTLQCDHNNVKAKGELNTMTNDLVHAMRYPINNLQDLPHDLFTTLCWTGFQKVNKPLQMLAKFVNAACIRKHVSKISFADRKTAVMVNFILLNVKIGKLLQILSTLLGDTTSTSVLGIYVTIHYVYVLNFFLCWKLSLFYFK